MRRLLLIFSFLLCAGRFFSAGAQQLNARSYTIENGLVNNDVLNIYQDSRGFIWLCTRGGLSRYDGSRFTNFTTSNGLVNDMINDVVEIAPQEFIIAQNSGGPVLLKNDRVQPLPQANKITFNRFYRSGDGRLLATTDYQGIVEWQNGQVKKLNAGFANSIHRMAKLNDSLWVVTDLDYSAQLVSSTCEPRSNRFATGVNFAYTDSRYRTWIGTSQGLRLLDPACQTGRQPAFLPLPPPFNVSLVSKPYISDMLEDSRGEYWIGTLNGLVHIDRAGKAFLYTELQGLPVPYANCIKEDNQKNIWVGTPMGVAKLPLQKEIKTIKPDLGFANTGMLAVLPLANNRARVFDRKMIAVLDLATGKLSDRKMIADSGYALYKLNPKQFLLRKGAEATVYSAFNEKAEKIAWPLQDFASLTRIDDQLFIGGTFGGIYSIKNGKSTEQMQTGKNSAIFAMAYNGTNTLWVGTFAEGLLKLRIDASGNSPQMTIIDTLAGRLPDYHIRALYMDKENELWIGTRYKGLVRLRELNGKYSIEQFGTAQGLCSDFVLAVNRDANGSIWIGTSQGVDKLVPEGDRYRIFNFGRVNKFFQNIGAIDFTDSNHIVGTGYPSIMYAHDMKRDGMAAFPVYITRVSAAPGDTTLYNGATTLPYNKSQIYFEFSSPQYINEDFGKFSYRLAGSNDPAWNIASNARNVYFASLRPGKYTFQVRTMGFNGEWGPPVSYEFTVEAPFWQKAWFIALVALGSGLLIYALYRYRVQQLIRLQKMRNRIATDLHDEIGSNLTNISILSNLGKRNILQPQKAGDFLERISEEVLSSSQALDDIIWSVDASHDTLEETVARMRRYAAELFDSGNISYDLDLDPAFEGKRLSMEQRRDIYLLYKEAVNNISKHAAASHVAIQIAIEYNHLLLSVKDDGRGFDTRRESTRHGLKGMKQRVKKWKGKIDIESAPGQGTFIQVRLPVSR